MQHNEVAMDALSSNMPTPKPKRKAISGVVTSTTPSQPSVDSVETKHGRDDIKNYVPGTSRRRKDFWNGFKSYRDKDNKIRAECIYCLKTYAADPSRNGTKNLGRHWKACLENPANKSEGKQAEPTVPNEIKSKEALMQMLITGELPFSCFEKSGVKIFFRLICPTFQLPSRETFARDRFTFYLREKVKLKKFLNKSCQRVCLSTELWTTNHTLGLGYVSLTARFIDNEWILQKKVLNLFPNDIYTCNPIGRGIETCLRHWDLSDKVFSITVDNAGANDVACAHLREMVAEICTCINHGKNLQVNCVAQTISLIVWDVLKEYSACVDKVRSVVDVYRYSRYKLFALKEEVEEDELDFDSESPFYLEVPTEWNSTYKMLEGTLINKDAFIRLDIPKDLVDSFGGHITSEEWSRIEMLVKFLKEFYDFTNHVSSFSNVTVNTTIVQIGHIVKLLNEWAENSDPVCRTMALEMKKKCDSHWGNFVKMNMLVFVAVILDPANKYVGLQSVLCRLLGDKVGDSLATRVKEFAYELFDEYKNTYASSSSQCESSESNECSALVDNGLRSSFVNDVNESDSDGLLKTELDCYLNEQNAKEVTDVLTWWKLNRLRFPILAHMARDVLAIPVSSVPSESAFSSEGRTFDEFRSSLALECFMSLQGLVCAGDWFGAKLPKSSSDDEFSLEELEKIERDFVLKF